MRSISVLALVLACAACASQPNPRVPPTGEGAGTAATTAEPPANQPPWHELYGSSNGGRPAAAERRGGVPTA
jgi:hypothetical protein